MEAATVSRMTLSPKCWGHETLRILTIKNLPVSSLVIMKATEPYEYDLPFGIYWMIPKGLEFMCNMAPFCLKVVHRMNVLTAPCMYKVVQQKLKMPSYGERTGYHAEYRTKFFKVKGYIPEAVNPTKQSHKRIQWLGCVLTVV